jgi:hypothetical protein
MTAFSKDELDYLDLLASWAESNGFTRSQTIRAAVIGFIDELSDDYTDNPQSSRFRMQTDAEAMAAIVKGKRVFGNPAAGLSTLEGWDTLTDDERAVVTSETRKLAALVPHLV